MNHCRQDSLTHICGTGGGGGGWVNNMNNCVHHPYVILPLWESCRANLVPAFWRGVLAYIIDRSLLARLHNNRRYLPVVIKWVICHRRAISRGVDLGSRWVFHNNHWLHNTPTHILPSDRTCAWVGGYMCVCACAYLYDFQYAYALPVSYSLIHTGSIKIDFNVNMVEMIVIWMTCSIFA